MSFGSTEGAFALKSCAAAHDLEGRLVPIPRALSTGCGVAWREPPANRTRLEEALSSEGIDYDQVVALRA